MSTNHKNDEVVNVEDLSLEKLRQLADEEAKGEESTEVQEDTKPEAETAQTVFRRVVDLGDGSGKQVFEAPTVDELLDKLTTAQLNATKKIREQAEQLRQLETVKQKANEQEKQLSEDEEFALSQELLTHPTSAVKKMFKQMTGYDISEFTTVAERAKAFDAAQEQRVEVQRQSEAANTFVNAHPEYVVNVANGTRLQKAINLLIADAKNQGQSIDYPTLLEQAYQDLTESGLLELKSEDDVTADTEPTGAAQRRIAATEEVVSTQRKKASGLSSRGRTTVAPKSNQPSESELYEMPLEKLRELANKGM